VKDNFDRKGNVILAISEHISKVLHLYQGEKKLEEMLPLGPNKALFYKGIASYLLPGQKSPWLFQKPQSVIMDKQVISMNSDPDCKQEIPIYADPETKEEVPMCTDPESKQELPVCTDPEVKQKLPVGTDREFNLEAPMCTHPEINQEDPMDMEPEIKQQVTVVSDPRILKVGRCASLSLRSHDKNISTGECVSEYLLTTC
jgi:hypothetical protein